MKFNLHVTCLNEPSETWIEDYNRSEVKTEEQARAYGESLIEYFNGTLRPGEQARKLVNVTFEDNNALEQHDWQKTNLVTIVDPRRGHHDTMQCIRCGITARRYGLIDIVVDRKFAAKKYRSCNPEVKK